MKKILPIIAFLVLHSIVFGQNSKQITISTEFPAKLKAGVESDFTIILQKPDIQPFAVYEQKFPPGLTVSGADLGRGIFDFKENTLTISWIRLPENDKIKLGLKVTANENMEGTYSSVGILNYLYNNRKGIVSSDTIEFTIEKATQTSKKNEETDKESEDSRITAKSDKTKNEFECIRTIEKKKTSKGTGWNVTLFIVNNSPEIGAAKIIEQFPKGYFVKADETTKAQINKGVENITFFWNKLPNEKGLTVSYELYSGDKTEKPSIMGNLSFARNKEVSNIKIKNQ